MVHGAIYIVQKSESVNKEDNTIEFILEQDVYSFDILDVIPDTTNRLILKDENGMLFREKTKQ